MKDIFEKEREIFKVEEIEGEPVETREYDIVVVGAGTPGVPCALKAAELGAKVCVIQKEKEASACGHIGVGIDFEKSNKKDLAKLISIFLKESDLRPNKELYEMYVENSGEALEWLIEKSKEAGAGISSLGNGPHKKFMKDNDLDLDFVTAFYGPKPYDAGEAMKDLSKLAEAKGVDFYYNTPAIKLIKEGNRVVGVYGKSDKGVIEFRAKNGVVIGTGDYQNDEQMKSHYIPAVLNLETKKFGRSGDGHKMIIDAGGHMELIGHTKMVHDMDAGPSSNMQAPLLRVKLNGKRFCNEENGMEYMNCFLLDEKNSGHYAEIFDANYLENAEEWGFNLAKLDELKKYMPEEDADREGVLIDLIKTFKADTLEELAEKLEIKDKEEFKKTIARYNEMAKNQEDTEFGKDAKYLYPIENPPYYGTHRHLRLTMICSGIEVDGNLRPLDDDMRPIEGVYAIGNLAGNFYGSYDYPLTLSGLNLGHNYTQGYVIGKRLAQNTH
ncbi:FAD-dependent oxidoreductase [Helcococcus kunzii]|uniref:FAD-dependent oxidoreductase n=1 Tax=Helcococcus kunzii TaxID=40091 RepID=UPI001BAEA745|nr:FAD-dependent oxidoreductase [Helcococcus kunzii]QUY65653.1 FAD-dependent oxidoreductase [Helcococcus kunzii]